MNKANLTPEKLRVTDKSKTPRKIREYPTGATRDSDDDKLDYFRCLDPLVTKRFLEYMQRHRVQPDGNLRGWDNWKLGIPEEDLVSSLRRHVQDVELFYAGYPEEMTETLEDSLCAAMFNIMALLRARCVK